LSYFLIFSRKNIYEKVSRNFSVNNFESSITSDKHKWLLEAFKKLDRKTCLALDAYNLKDLMENDNQNSKQTF